MAIPENIQTLIQPEADLKKKTMVAKGLFPMPPHVQIEVLGTLLDDGHPDIRKHALDTLIDMPKEIMIGAISQIDHQKILHILMMKNAQDNEVLEKILLNKFCSSKTVQKIAAVGSEQICTLIMNNQVRLLKDPEIAEDVKKNKNALQSDIDRMVSFLRLNGITLDGEANELTLDEIEQILSMPDDDMDESLVKDFQEPPSEEERKSLYALVKDLNVAQKIKIALKGNKEARTLLFKDRNKLVSTSVIKNPKITDKEILQISQNKSAQDEVLRIICLNTQWVKHYSIQNALANNPKTPLQNAMRFMKMLNSSDLKRLSNNKNAHSQIQKMAKKLYQKKRG